jgi:hypothetical protein
VIRAAVRIAIGIFIAMLLFGGVETLGFLHHAWAWVDTVIHGSHPMIKLPAFKVPPGLTKPGSRW